VAKRLTAGQVTLVTVSGWGFVGDFLAFLDEIGFYAQLGIETTYASAAEASGKGKAEEQKSTNETATHKEERREKIFIV